MLTFNVRYTPSQIAWMEEQPEAPKPLSEREDLFEDLTPVWEAFWFLNGGRTITESGPSPISLFDIVTYWRDLYGYRGELLAEKTRLVKMMDDEFLTLMREKLSDGRRRKA